MSRPIPAALKALARLYGVQTSYRDMRGQDKPADPQVVLRILKLLGAPLEGLEEAGKALLEKRRTDCRRGLEAATVLWNGRGRIPLCLPHTERGAVDCHLQLEEGEEFFWRFRPESAKTLKSFEIGGEAFVARKIDLPRPRLPLGYHRLSLRQGERSMETLLLCAPRQAHPNEMGRSWGVFAPLYALRSASNPGCGNLRDLKSLLVWVQKLGGNAISTLPLLATFLGSLHEPSPYSPISRLFWNELYLDFESLREMDGSPEAKALLHSAQAQAELKRLRAREWVDYEGVAAWQRRCLEPLSMSLELPSVQEELRRRLEIQPELMDYARFRACCEAQGRRWQEWPERMRQGQLQPGDYDAAALRRHLYAQWKMQIQMEEIGNAFKRENACLYLDYPLGIHPAGYDAWKHPGLFAQGASGGAPPDPMFTAGQNWGFPPLHPQADRQQGYAYFRRALETHLKAAGMLRIDHVMGLHRLFWIPQGCEGSEGLYVSYPHEELYAILALESRRHGACIAGEDLGTVPPAVKPAMDRHGIQHLYVAEYELAGSAKGRLPTPPRRSIASLNTHDMFPFAAYWKGLEIRERRRLGFVDFEAARIERRAQRERKAGLSAFLAKRGRLAPASSLGARQAFEALLAYLATSPAELLLINLEDLWQEVIPQNIPSSGEKFPNWKHKMKWELERFGTRQPLPARLQDMLEKSRRSRKGGLHAARAR